MNRIMSLISSFILCGTLILATFVIPANAYSTYGHKLSGGVGQSGNYTRCYWVDTSNFTSSWQTHITNANFDGTVTADDARLIIRYSTGLDLYSDEQFVRSDINGDGIISVADAQFVLRYSIGSETEFTYFV